MKLLFILLVFGAMGSAAVAQEPAHSPAPSEPTWNGSYAGAVLGYGDASSVHCDSLCGGSLDNHPEPNGSSAIYGLTAGYNTTNGRIVVGVEADIMFGAFEGVAPDTTRNLGAGRDTFTNISGFGTLRGRIGLDRGGFMPFVTAGIAVMSVEAGLLPAGPGDSTPSRTDLLVSPVAGLGAEWMLDTGWSIKAEYLHVFDTGDFFYDFPGGREWCNDPGCSVTDVSIGMVRVGVNYHF